MLADIIVAYNVMLLQLNCCLVSSPSPPLLFAAAMSTSYCWPILLLYGRPTTTAAATFAFCIADQIEPITQVRPYFPKANLWICGKSVFICGGFFSCHPLNCVKTL